MAIIGPNGAGKTTLLRLLAGELSPDAGTIKVGLSVVPGYYAQHHFDREAAWPAGTAVEPGLPEPPAKGLALNPLHGFGALDPRQTVLDALWEVVPAEGEAYVRGVAGGFLFSGDDVEKTLGVLSGGERARVALARILLLRSNLLLLDEPTTTSTSPPRKRSSRRSRATTAG